MKLRDLSIKLVSVTIALLVAISPLPLAAYAGSAGGIKPDVIRSCSRVYMYVGPGEYEWEAIYVGHVDSWSVRLIYNSHPYFLWSAFYSNGYIYIVVHNLHRYSGLSLVFEVCWTIY